MKFEQTTDSRYVNRCLRHPAIWRMGADDGMLGVMPELFFIQSNGSLWLKADEYGVLIGEPRNCVTMDVHVALLPKARGEAVDICKGAIDWVFSHTCYKRLNAGIPEYNHLAIRLASKVGMEFIGINKKSFMKNGVLYDQHLFGISKGE